MNKLRPGKVFYYYCLVSFLTITPKMDMRLTPFIYFCCRCLHALTYITDPALCLDALKEAFRTFSEWAQKNEMAIWCESMTKRDIVSTSLLYSGLHALKYHNLPETPLPPNTLKITHIAPKELRNSGRTIYTLSVTRSYRIGT